MGATGSGTPDDRHAAAVAEAAAAIARAALSPTDQARPWTLEEALRSGALKPLLQGVLDALAEDRRYTVLRTDSGRRSTCFDVVRSLKVACVEVPLAVSIAAAGACVVDGAAGSTTRRTLACLACEWPAVLHVRFRELLPVIKSRNRIDVCLAEIGKLCDEAALGAGEGGPPMCLHELTRHPTIGIRYERALVELCHVYTTMYYGEDEIRADVYKPGDEVASRTIAYFIKPVDGGEGNWPLVHFPDRPDAPRYIALPARDWPRAFAKYAALKFIDLLNDEKSRQELLDEGGASELDDQDPADGEPAPGGGGAGRPPRDPFEGGAWDGEGESEEPSAETPAHVLAFELALTVHLGKDADIAIYAYQAFRKPVLDLRPEFARIARELGVPEAEVVYLALIAEQFAVVMLPIAREERKRRYLWAAFSSEGPDLVPEPKAKTRETVGMEGAPYKRRLALAGIMTLLRYTKAEALKKVQLPTPETAAACSDKGAAARASLADTLTTVKNNLAALVHEESLGPERQVEALKRPYAKL